MFFEPVADFLWDVLHAPIPGGKICFLNFLNSTLVGLGHSCSCLHSYWKLGAPDSSRSESMLYVLLLCL